MPATTAASLPWSVTIKTIAWDTIGGVARRNWARNEHAIETAIEYNRLHQGTDHITIPYLTDEDLVKESVKKLFE